MKTANNLADPFRQCEESCTHDLASGVSIRDLLSRDGPQPGAHHTLAPGAVRAVLLPRLPDTA